MQPSAAFAPPIAMLGKLRSNSHMLNRRLNVPKISMVALEQIESVAADPFNALVRSKNRLPSFVHPHEHILFLCHVPSSLPRSILKISVA